MNPRCSPPTRHCRANPKQQRQERWRRWSSRHRASETQSGCRCSAVPSPFFSFRLRTVFSEICTIYIATAFQSRPIDIITLFRRRRHHSGHHCALGSTVLTSLCFLSSPVTRWVTYVLALRSGTTICPYLSLSTRLGRSRLLGPRARAFPLIAHSLYRARILPQPDGYNVRIGLLGGRQDSRPCINRR